MMFLLYTLHVLICLFLIAVVLLQQGKGADLSVFGGGGTQTAFGARGAATVLHKLTVGSFIGFIVTTLAIGVVQKQQAASVIQGLPEQEISAPADVDGEAGEATEAEAEGAIPTGEPAADGTEATAVEEGAEGGDVAPAAADAADDSSAGDQPPAEASSDSGKAEGS